MLRCALILAVSALVQQATVQNAANDNPAVRALVREAIKKELSARDSKDKGWHDGSTWIWLDNPAANLAVDITNFTLQDGRLAVEGRAAALIGFDRKLKLPIGSKTFGGEARVYLVLKASAQVGEQLASSNVSIGNLEIHDLRLHGEAGRAFQGIIQEGANLLLKHKKRDIEKRLEDALNKAGVGRVKSEE